jgi:hypothetical protein
MSWLMVGDGVASVAVLRMGWGSVMHPVFKWWVGRLGKLCRKILKNDLTITY